MDEEEEQLDYEEEGEEEQLLGDDEDEEHFDGEEEAGYEDPDAPQDVQEAEEDELAGLGDAADEDTMQDNMPASNGHADDEHMQEQQGQQQQAEQVKKQVPEGQDDKEPKKCDLTQRSTRLDRLMASKGQQPQQQPQPQQGRAPISKPTPSSKVRGPLRYFMLRSVNTDNWETAKQQGVWGTQPRNEAKFNEAFRKGCEVVFFLSAGRAATCIHGYGRMCSFSGQAPIAPWLDIDRNKVNNFHVSWDCTTPINYRAVEHLKNPWCDPHQGALSKGEPRPLKRHIDGHELAPQIGEQLLEAMNSNAAKAGKPATGPLAQGVRGGAAAARPGWPQQQQHPQQQQMHMQQRMMMQQPQRGVGGMPGRGMMGGPHAGMGMGPGPLGPNRGPVGLAGRLQQQQQPAPPMGGRMQPVGANRPLGGPLASDPRLNPRFAGRLRMDPADDFPPGGSQGAPYRSSRRSPPHHDHRGDSRDERERERHRSDGRDRRYEGELERDRGDDRHRQGQGHGSRSRRHSRSRSRSPPRAASSRGGSTGRPGGAGVVESSFGSPDKRRGKQQQQDEEEASVQDMSYEQYLETWEKVQARLKRLDATQQPQEQQLQLALVPSQQQQQAQNGLMGVRGAGVRGAVMGGDVGGGFPPPPGGVLRAGVGAAGVGVDGAVGPGRPAGNLQFPTLAEYAQRIRARLAESGKPIPPDSVILQKYQEKMQQHQLQQGGQQLQQQRMQPGPPAQQQLAMGPAAGVGMMGMGAGMAPMDPMNMAMNTGMAPMNPINMMATAMAAAAATNMMGMMGQGMGGAMMGPGGGPGGMVGQGVGPMQLQQQGMGGPGGQMMGGGGGRGSRGQMIPMQQQMGGGF